MKKLQELREQDDIFLYIFANEEFSKINLYLSKEQLDSFVSQIKNEKKNLILNLSKEQLFKAGYNTEEEVLSDIANQIKDTDKKIYKFIEDILNDDSKVLKLADRLAIEKLNFMYKVIPQYFFNQQERHEKVKKNIDEFWGHALDLFELLIVTVQEISENLDVTKLNDYNSNQDLYDALRRLHGRSCLVGYEILILLRAGFADGAYSRFRTLYETVIIGNFILDNGNEAAIKYLDFSLANDLKEAKLFNEYSSTLNDKPVPEEEILKLEEIKKQLIKEHGENFAKGDYGWASSFLDKKRVTFRDIEEKIDFSYMRPHYKSASGKIHTGSSSLYSHIALPPEDNGKILTGASAYGIDVPCRLTSYYLAMMTSNLLLNQSQSLEQIIYGQLLGKLRDDIIETLDCIR